MKPHLVDLVCCPDCHGDLHLRDPVYSKDEIESGWLVCYACTRQHPILRFVPRFVSSLNYAENFGWQWNQFRQTQLDSHSGVPISRERFFNQTGWSPEGLAGKTVLDVGCGAGRFAEVALSCCANLVALDYSSAVDACWANLGPHPRLNVVQGDVYSLPFFPGQFDYVYCLGVLQHTPDVEKAFSSLPEQLCPGGRLAVDLYPKLLLNILWPKYWLRPFTKRLPQRQLVRSVQLMVKLLLPFSRVVARIPYIGRKLRFAIPVVNYEGILPLSCDQLKEWSVLDTFDMLAPEHDHPQSERTLHEWFTAAGLNDVEVFRAGQLVGRGIRDGQ